MMLPDLDDLDAMDTEAAERGFDMLGRALVCLAIAVPLGALTWLLA